MRIICTNCDAEYDIPDEAIPDTGRDVQCSNCSHVWFVHPHSDPTKQTKTAPKPEVSPEARKVLQEEAEREIAARRAEAQPNLETQPELGIQPAPRRGKSPMRFGNRTRTRENPPADTSPPMPEVRQSELPDIEEVNTNLTVPELAADIPPHKRDEPVSAKRIAPRATFRVGFLTSVTVLALATIVYIYASEIALVAPYFVDHINSYVLWVNDLRQQVYEFVNTFVPMA
ncbi:MAG: zinc-ribbon domain-containing protein [Pseudomonadota bacterium]